MTKNQCNFSSKEPYFLVIIRINGFMDAYIEASIISFSRAVNSV